MKKRTAVALGIITAILICLFLLVAFFGSELYRLYPDDSYKIAESTGEKDVVLSNGDYVLFGNLSNQPLCWKVLNEDGGTILLQTEKVVLFMQFDNPDENSARADYRRFGSAEWDTSYLKAYLNSEDGFLKEFNRREKSLIDGEVFVLSKNQIEEFLSPSERRKTATTAAIRTNTSQYLIFPNQTVWWWTSSGINANDISECAVTSSGTFYKSVASDKNVGVCPAVYMKANQTVLSGDGSKDNPYYVSVEDVQT